MSMNKEMETSDDVSGDMKQYQLTIDEACDRKYWMTNTL